MHAITRVRHTRPRLTKLCQVGLCQVLSHCGHSCEIATVPAETAAGEVTGEAADRKEKCAAGFPRSSVQGADGKETCAAEETDLS